MKSLTEANAGSALTTIAKFGNKIGKYANYDTKIFKKNGKNDIYLGGSISNYAQNLIMTFPLLCDNTLSPETASMISRANERNIVTMLQLLFASEQFNAGGGAQALSTIYKGIKSNMSLDDYIDVFGDIADKSMYSIDSNNGTNQFTKTMYGESVQMAPAVYNENVKEINRQNLQTQKSFPINNFSEKSINDYKVYNLGGKQVVKEDSSNGSPFYPYNDPDSITNMPSADGAKELNRFNQKERELNQRDMDLAHKINQDKYRNRYNYSKDYYDNQIGYNQKQLLDTDVRKANEMQPTLILVRYNELGPISTKDGEGIIGQRTFIAGVKSRLIPVDASDIADRINVKNKTKINFLNFIRATTGEISFIKDFLLNLNQAKLDSKNAVKKGPAAKMWKTLEFRATNNERRKLGKAGNDASAITGLVISQETVNMIKKLYDFDIENVKNATMIMDSYNLLSIIIADESIEVVKFLYAGNASYEQQAYSYLEKESSDKSYKKVINLISQANGR